jgi:hypothetical protein
MLLLAGLRQAAAQGTAFTYQGQLNDSGRPASGIYDLQFALFDAATNGNQVGGTVTNLAIGMTNGLFTTTIDFGPGIFTGGNYWLQIGVETNGAGGTFTILNALQPLTPTPYAIYSSSTSIASGQVVKSLNGLQDAVTLLPGTNVTISPSGNALSISASGVPTMQVFTSSGTFTVPAGVSRIMVAAWGGGGGGGASYGQYSGGGGGGGGFGQGVFSVTPGTLFTVTVGAGGSLGSPSGTTPQSGGTTSFGSLLSASGGGASQNAGLATGPQIGGLGGTSSATLNITGAQGSGGATGSSVSSASSSNQAYPAGGAGGAAGGNGGGGGGGGRGNYSSSYAPNPGANGAAPGGGGGGGGTSWSSSGGSGGNGLIVVYW